jgi:hypothetical protein
MSQLADALSFQGKDWKPIPHISRTVPFGYEVDENDPDLLQPIPFELEALVKAKHYLKQYSYREVAQWLTKTTGRPISHMGLKKRVESENRRRTKAQVLERWAKRIEETRAKAEKLSNSYLGAHEDGTEE